MRKYIQGFSLKRIILTAAVVLCLILWGGLSIFAVVSKNQLQDQNVAARWSAENDAAQISCFLTKGTEIDKNSIITFEHKLDSALKESSLQPPNENARLWADAYSSQGQITLKSGKVTLDAKAVGIGGDFFLFHPLQLITGTYFSGNDLMYDRVIIDEDAAWQLFGSNDVVGMEVRIGGIPHYISGVIQREEGRFNEAAGLDKTVVYVSNETLEKLGVSEGINTYEIVMPNPVSGFAYAKVKENFGVDEHGMWVMDNTERFSFKSLFTVISEFGLRSMNAQAIQYPYWENVARGWEDVLAVILVLQMLFLLVPAVIVVVWVIILWKRKNWSWRDVINGLQKCRDNVWEHCRKEKNKWKHF